LSTIEIETVILNQFLLKNSVWNKQKLLLSNNENIDFEIEGKISEINLIEEFQDTEIQKMSL
jgi:hypothetical protein